MPSPVKIKPEGHIYYLGAANASVEINLGGPGNLRLVRSYLYLMGLEGAGDHPHQHRESRTKDLGDLEPVYLSNKREKEDLGRIGQFCYAALALSSI